MKLQTDKPVAARQVCLDMADIFKHHLAGKRIGEFINRAYVASNLCTSARLTYAKVPLYAHLTSPPGVDTIKCLCRRLRKAHYNVPGLKKLERQFYIALKKGDLYEI